MAKESPIADHAYTMKRRSFLSPRVHLRRHWARLVAGIVAMTSLAFLARQCVVPALRVAPWRDVPLRSEDRRRLLNHSGIPTAATLSRLRRGSSVLQAMTEHPDTATALLVALCSVPNRDSARKIAQELVTQRLAACVSTVPAVESTYWWQGAVETAEELLLVIKTSQDRAQGVMDSVQANHPYDTPELIFLPIRGGLPKYLAWLVDSVGDPA